jgi:hypothetical protein
MKVKAAKHYCKGCIWLIRGNLCPFSRCVKRYGWNLDQKQK